MLTAILLVLSKSGWSVVFSGGDFSRDALSFCHNMVRHAIKAENARTGNQ